jgi:primosomal replication protein N
VSANRLTLTATLTQKEPLRYSPAGIPILKARLLHQSEQVEGGTPRSVTCEIPAIAIGDVAIRMDKSLQEAQPETEWQFSGFLATKRRFEIAELHIIEFFETSREPVATTTPRNR